MNTFTSFPWSNYDCIQDPIYHSYLHVSVFFDSYRELLESLDGSDCDSYIESFFNQSRINSRMLVFIDEDARLDFEDLAIEMNLVQSLKEICEGETSNAKMERKRKEDDNKRSRQIQQSKRPQKQTQKQNADRRQVQARKSMNKLRERLNNETDPLTIETIKKKMMRVNDILDIPVTI